MTKMGEPAPPSYLAVHEDPLDVPRTALYSQGNKRNASALIVKAPGLLPDLCCLPSISVGRRLRLAGASVMLVDRGPGQSYSLIVSRLHASIVCQTLTGRMPCMRLRVAAVAAHNRSLGLWRSKAALALSSAARAP
jgi:hypothetical protein